MSYYEDVYLKRLNRYGYDYQSRVQKQREREFEGKLLKSLYRVDFEYQGETHPATLERYKQNETQTLQYLLTRVDLELPDGTILMIPNSKGEERFWLVYWLEEIQASGYNRYVVLKMTHYIEWIDRAGEKRGSWAYMYGQEDNMLKDELRSRSRMDTLYVENLKMSFFVMPTNVYLRKEDYLVVGEGPLAQGYTVTGYDTHSAEGIEFVTVDPVYLHDNSPVPEVSPEEPPEESFWLKGVKANECTEL